MPPLTKKWKNSTNKPSGRLPTNKEKSLLTREEEHAQLERFKQTIQWLLEDRQISETELSRLTNLSPATIHRLIYGITDPRLSTLRAIASFFKIKIEQLIGDYPISSVTQVDKSSDKVLFSTPILIPFIEWEELTNHATNISELTMNNWANWHVTINETSDNTATDLFATKLNYTAGDLLHAESILIIKSINSGEKLNIGDCVIGTNKKNTLVGQISGSGDDIQFKGGNSIPINKCILYGTIIKCEIPCSKISRYTAFI